jgi:hypothetical protein
LHLERVVRRPGLKTITMAGWRPSSSPSNAPDMKANGPAAFELVEGLGDGERRAA